ncbi:phosphoribosyltransferase domain-containing protein [Novosphingobium sp.]|uniref:phosphoribosyltransferase domain-containing protein n=1 Tax=Novosphingobium sp. TaxID=1874826 RepID=UPI0038BD8579
MIDETINAKPRHKQVVLPTGTLNLTIEHGPDIDDLCDFAARANPKRGFLIVSKVLGRHIPARPAVMRKTMDELAASISSDLSQPVVFLGMAETATALGQGVFAAFQAHHPAIACLYLQTSRQRLAGLTPIATFEEGHSHATSHLVQIEDLAMLDFIAKARTLIVVDDECSTGNTFISAAEGMLVVMPNLEQVDTCCITDWSGGKYLSGMPRPANSHSVLSGSMSWEANPAAVVPQLAAGSNGAGNAPENGMRSRCGLWQPEVAIRPAVECQPGYRVLVLGDGEHSYEALRIAEEIEAQGGIAAVQSITRTPALVGHAMRTRSEFNDAYGSTAPAFLYNMLEHDPYRVIIAAEIEAGQVQDAHAALVRLGASLQVELMLCHYSRDA